MRRLILIAGLAMVPLACEPPPADDAVRADVDRGPVRASVTISPAEATTGERIDVTLEVQTEANVVIAKPLLAVPEDGVVGGLNILQSSETIDLPLEHGGRLLTQKLIVDSFAPGEHEFPAIAIEFKDGRTEPTNTGQIETEPLTITIVSTLDASEAGLHDIDGWIDLPGPPWWPWVLAIGCGVAIVGGLGLWFALRERDEGPPPTAAEIARAAMRTLRGKQYLQRGDANAFYTNLSNIVRQYIEGRLGLRAPRKTTDEFLRDAQQDARLTDSQRLGLHEFLRTADLVKFAMHEPDIEQGTQAIDEADQFVNEVEATFIAVPSDEHAPTAKEASAC